MDNISEAEANRKASKLFLLKRISPDPNYQARGNTQMVWTAGLFGLVKFVPWNDFDELWADSMKSLRMLPPSALTVATQYMDTARTQVETEEAEDKLIRESQLRQGNITPDSANTTIKRIWNNSASISQITSLVVSSVEDLLRRSLGTRRRSYSLKFEREASMSSEFITLESGEKLQFELPQSLISDVALMLRNLHPDLSEPSKSEMDKQTRFEGGMEGDLRSLPLCHIEMKGPTLELAGIHAAKQVHKDIEARKQKAHKQEPLKISKRRTSKVAKRKSSETSRATFEGNAAIAISQGGSPDAQSTTENSGYGLPLPTGTEAPRPYSATEVAENFNFLFSNIEYLDTKSSLGGPIRDSIYRISQAVTSAVLSLGGCTFLYNVETGIGFHVAGMKENTLVVRVTSVLLSDGDPNNVSAMYAIAKNCLNRYFSECNEMMSSLRANALALGISAVTRDDHSCESSHDAWEPGDEESNEEADGDINDGSWSSGEASLLVKLGMDMDHFAACNMERIGPTMSPTSVRKGLSNLGGTRLKEIDTILMDMFRRNEGVSGSGSSGIVLMGQLGGTKVAIKTAFDNCQKGANILRAEIKIYQALRRKGSYLLGTVLPRLILGWDKPKVNSVYAGMVFLVTEYVGSGLVRDRNGTLWIGDQPGTYRKVDAAEEHLICESALDGLQQLRDNGLLHGDVALRNLRAERVESQSEVIWKTWWVDLGLASEIKSRQDARMYVVERRDARALFNVRLGTLKRSSYTY